MMFHVKFTYSFVSFVIKSCSGFTPSHSSSTDDVWRPSVDSSNESSNGSNSASNWGSNNDTDTSSIQNKNDQFYTSESESKGGK